jgi:hypothetical protein
MRTTLFTLTVLAILLGCEAAGVARQAPPAVALERVQFAGFKLFYQQDRPLMGVADVLGLKPVPLFVLYQ